MLKKKTVGKIYNNQIVYRQFLRKKNMGKNLLGLQEVENCAFFEGFVKKAATFDWRGEILPSKGVGRKIL